MSRARKDQPRPRSSQPKAAVDSLTVIHPNAAGIDIGLDDIWVSVPEDRTDDPVRRFASHTPDLIALAEWLKACGIQTVAMESTGVYWIPLYELLEERQFQVYLVNARHVKNVAGRKTDELDCQWIRRLHSFGLLNNSFRPPQEMCAVRAYMRHRAELIEHRSAHIQHMQKALHQMNVKLSPTVQDITGVTGLAIIRAIVAGERNPVELARWRQPGCKRPEADFVKALTGNYRDEHVFALKQALALYDAYTAQLQECDQELQRKFSALKPVPDEVLPPLDPTDKKNTHSKNGFSYDARDLFYHLLGVDLVAINGFNEVTVATIITEIGTDPSHWKNDKRLSAWLSLAPRKDISGGQVLRSHIAPARNRAGQALRLAAQAVSRTDTALGAYFRRIRAKHGAAYAIVATAHKMARIVFAMLRDRKPYEQVSADVFTQRERERELDRLQKKATKLGYTLTPASA